MEFRASVQLSEALIQVQKHLDDQQFPEALEACLHLLSGPDRAMKMLRDTHESLHRYYQDRAVSHQDELRSMTAQLMAAKDRADALRQSREKQEMEFRTERERREDLEAQCAWLQRRSQLFEEAQRENSRLKQDLREARRQPRTAGNDEVVRKMADMECVPLRGRSSAERVAMKKKLLLKWHPDKQPSPDHAALATQVMQELQNRPEWGW
jgi:chromosome segregation ATPase